MITVTKVAGSNAVLSGLFFDPPSTPGSDVLNVTGVPAMAPAGAPETFTVTALEPNGNIDPTYLGTVHFTSTDSHAVLPAYYTFTRADGGTHVFTATFETAGVQSITATDTSTASITGSESSISVQPAAAHTLTVTGLANPATAGSAGSFTVTAYDQYGNVATGYAGTIHVTSSDSQAVLPGNYTFMPNDAGVHTFSATLKTSGVQSITATDTSTASIVGSDLNISVQPAAAYSLKVTGLANPATAGTASNFTVTAYDQYGNVATGYAGTIHFASSDSQAVLPGNYSFKSNDAGIHTFSATLNTAGVQWITTTDTSTATITGSASVTVNAGSSASAVFVKTDTTTLGSWIGVYGKDGYSLAGNATSYPAYVTVSTAGESNFTWVASSAATRALQNASGTGRLAACWYSTSSFTIRANFTDGQAHDFAVYAIDWDTTVRSERIQITSAATGAVLDTESISNFSGGAYLQWQVTGSVVITVTKVAGSNAVLSGLFFDAPTTTASSLATATFVSQSDTTQDAWTALGVVPADPDTDGATSNGPGDGRIRPLRGSQSDQLNQFPAFAKRRLLRSIR